MENLPPKKAMPKEVSALNTYWLIEYLEQHHPELDLPQLIEQAIQVIGGAAWVENLRSGEIEQVTIQHLKTPRYWFSHIFVKSLHDLIQEHIPDPRLGFNIGRSMYKTQPLIRTTLGVSLLGTHRIAQKVSKEAAKFNRTKKYVVQRLEKGHIELRIVHNPGIVTSEFTMQWNAGCFASYARLAGATDIKVDLRCIDAGPQTPEENRCAIWDFELRYQEPGVLNRLARNSLRILPWIRKLTEQAEDIETEHQQQILDRDNIIKERTKQLLSIQQRLIKEEREIIGQKLQEISMELATTEERERKAIAEDLHDSVTQLLALSLSKVKVAVQSRNNEDGELVEIRDCLEQALTDLRSLTFQISPPVLYDFGLEAALEWLINDVNSRHNMRLVFTNLLDSPLQPGQQQKVTMYRSLRELIINIIKHGQTKDGQLTLSVEDGRLIVEVEDEGVGFDLETVARGFGLFSLNDRLLCISGNLTIDSMPGEGTIITLTVPLEQMMAASDMAEMHM